MLSSASTIITLTVSSYVLLLYCIAVISDFHVSETSLDIRRRRFWHATFTIA